MYVDFRSYLLNLWSNHTRSRGGRIAVIIVIPLCILAIWFYGIFSPLQTRIRGYKERINQLHQESLSLLVQCNQFSRHNEKTEMLKKKWENYQKSNTYSIINLSDLITNAGLQLDSFTINDTVKKEWYNSQRATFRCSGPFKTVIDFFSNLKKLPIPPSCPICEITTDAASGITHIAGEIRFLSILPTPA